MNRLPEDPVVAEIHAIRQALLDECGGDINEYRRRARERQSASGRQIITVPFRKRTEPKVEPERRIGPTPKAEALGRRRVNLGRSVT